MSNCYKCGNEGHYAHACPDQEDGRAGKKGNVIYYLCVEFIVC